MQQAGIILDYALFGATAQMRYTEPVATFDAAVLVALADPTRLDVLSDIYTFCAAEGYQADGEAITVGAWPTQFIPAFSPLTEEAMAQAVTADYEGTTIRGRAKDLTRVLSLLESGSVTRESIRALAERHGRSEAWQKSREGLPWPEKVRIAECRADPGEARH